MLCVFKTTIAVESPKRIDFRLVIGKGLILMWHEGNVDYMLLLTLCSRCTLKPA